MFGVNPYNPYGYPNPQFNFGNNQMPQQNMQQSYMQQTQQNVQNVSDVPTVVYVPTVKHVEQTQVPAGNKAFIVVQNAPVIALKTADNMGIATTDFFKLEKINPDEQQAVNPEYVTKAEFQAFVNSLKNSSKTDKKAKEE